MIITTEYTILSKRHVWCRFVMSSKCFDCVYTSDTWSHVSSICVFSFDFYWHFQYGFYKLHVFQGIFRSLLLSTIKRVAWTIWAGRNQACFICICGSLRHLTQLFARPGRRGNARNCHPLDLEFNWAPVLDGIVYRAFILLSQEVPATWLVFLVLMHWVHCQWCEIYDIYHLPFRKWSWRWIFFVHDVLVAQNVIEHILPRCSAGKGVRRVWWHDMHVIKHCR